MKELTNVNYRFVQKTVNSIVRRHKLKDTALSLANPFLFSLFVPVSNGVANVAEACNELFHEFGVSPSNKKLQVGECEAYCSMSVDEDGFDIIAQFNHPIARTFAKGDEEYQFTLKGIVEADSEAAKAEESEVKTLIEGIKSGRLKSKNSDGYLVLAGRFYDAIESGKKKVEYRDFTAYNLKRTIGIRTIRFNRGYGSRGRPPKQMKWEVNRVLLLDDDKRECDPMRTPDGFWPAAIAIHLGQRVD